MLDTDRLLAEVTSSTDTLAGLTSSADPATQVTTCPDWTWRQLITHVGRGQRWAATIVAARAAEPIPFREVPDGRLPDDPADRPDWLRHGAAQLAGAVHDAGTSTMWTPVGTGPASSWARRMAHETAVHRADGQITLGIRPVIDPVIAADGIDEWLGFSTEPGEHTTALPEGKVLHLHTTDEGADGEWLVRSGPDGIVVAPGHAKGDTAVRGPASALLLLLVRRLPPDDPAVEIIGDRALLDGWLAATPF